MVDGYIAYGYIAYVDCDNCGCNTHFSVEAKVLVKDHLRLKSEKCLNCGFRLKQTSKPKGL